MNSRDFSRNAGWPRVCLGSPAHLVEHGEDVCQVCGTVVQETLIGAYQVKHLLGSGRGYQLYLATHSQQGQPVLVKVFPPDPASQHLWEKACQEIDLLATLHHSSILPILSCTLWNPGGPRSTGPRAETFNPGAGSLPFLTVVYQYAPLTFYHLLSPGDSKVSQATRLPVKQLLRLVEQAAGALALAHHLGVVHGALGPEQVLLNAPMDQLWLADFGVARLYPSYSPFLAPELVAICELCRQRQDVTPYWEAVTEASDQYALAALCYQLFLHAVPPETFQRIGSVIQHACQSNPKARFPQIQDFSTALAAEFGVGFLSDLPQDHALDARERRGAAASLFVPSPAPAPAPTASQQASQSEQLAGKWFIAHEYERAEQAYRQASRLDPTRISVWQGLADTYVALERYGEALDGYGKVLDLDPKNAEAWFNRATVFDLLGRPDLAARAYVRAEQLRAESGRFLE